MWFSSALRRLFFLVLLCGLSLTTVGAQELPNWSTPLTDLKEVLEQLKVRSVTQEKLIASLQNDNEQLKMLSTSQRDDLQRQAEMLDRSLNSSIEASASWTNYLTLSERHLKEALNRVHRNRLVWQIGIPVAFVGGVIVGARYAADN
jgi:hypothetical protein